MKKIYSQDELKPYIGAEVLYHDDLTREDGVKGILYYEGWRYFILHNDSRHDGASPRKSKEGYRYGWGIFHTEGTLMDITIYGHIQTGKIKINEHSSFKELINKDGK